MVEEASLPLADLLGVGRLKYLRQRSLRNPRWRDAGYVRLLIVPRQVRWSRPSVLDPQLAEVRATITEYQRRAAGRGVVAADSAWQEVLNAVDRLIAEGERIKGSRIAPRSL
ncbi:hypothetical protein Lfu02_39540 [Longispora fulva]|uniref:Uncharacterized protein n=1 Tax=Longispora fulva TaxID=619741 RepID=A0A8J7KJ06_9ACTN|nr:hypothetical protein [Longispora fulva]MBG6136414.1 hypothetical protein [Longispora fulva]GIG59582.1 hypothetical protein Lfu02_39540 [Longispora fulva]